MNRILRRLHTSFGAPAPSGATDRQLLERFLGGDQEAFAALVTRHARTVLAACRHVLSDPADVDDAFQATFLVLFKKARGLAWEESIGRWLYAVAHRIAVHARANAARRRNREASAGRQRQVEAAKPDLSWREACAILHEELDRLPERFRLPLLLCYLQGQSRDEAARNLGWTPGTVKGRLERGRQELASRLARRGIGLSAGLLAATAASPAKGAGLPADQVGRTVRAVVGGANESIRTLARGTFPGVLAGKRAVASVLVLTALLGLGTGWFAATGAAREEPAVADKESAPATKKPERAAHPHETRQVSGDVVDPDGKPVAGAKLLVPALRSNKPAYPENRDVRTVATTGADGRFSAAVDVARTADVKSLLIAYAPGFGVNWVEIDGGTAATPVEDLTIRLARDVPITGRVISTEGRPIPGLSVSVAVIQKPNDDKLDDYLATWKKEVRAALSSPRERFAVALSLITGPTTTDQDGRFTLRGAGAERIVQVLIHGGGAARGRAYVVTRPGFDPRPYNELLLRKENDRFRVLNHFRGLFAPDFTFIAEPGRQLTGVMTDAGTGQPIPGCRVSTFTSLGDVVDAPTDVHGRYQLDGVPKNPKGYLVYVVPPPGSDYLAPQAPEAPESDGYAPVRLDAKLARGAVVTGRVIDKQTGKGVRSGVRFVPLADNKFFGTKPEYSGYNNDRGLQKTDADGKFRVVTIPGPALLMAAAFEGEKQNGEEFSPYRNATPDPDHKELFQWDGRSWRVVAAQNFVEFLDEANAVKVVDIKETGQTTVEVSFDRGVTAKLVIQDADGQPLAGAWVAGVTEHWAVTYRLKDPVATVFALDRTKPRTLVAYHPERHLGGTITIDPEAKGPTVAKLGPLARVTGRLLDADGQPLAGATVSLFPIGRTAIELYRDVHPGGPPVASDKEGRFTLVDVVPGIALQLQYLKGQTTYAAKQRDKTLTLKPGETLDVGDRTLEPQQ
jgi:RNA polymerase sigma factor (sigma-70 family)